MKNHKRAPTHYCLQQQTSTSPPNTESRQSDHLRDKHKGGTKKNEEGETSKSRERCALQPDDAHMHGTRGGWCGGRRGKVDACDSLLCSPLSFRLVARARLDYHHGTRVRIVCCEHQRATRDSLPRYTHAPWVSCWPTRVGIDPGTKWWLSRRRKRKHRAASHGETR